MSDFLRRLTHIETHTQQECCRHKDRKLEARRNNQGSMCAREKLETLVNGGRSVSSYKEEIIVQSELNIRITLLRVPRLHVTSPPPSRGRLLVLEVPF